MTTYNEKQMFARPVEITSTCDTFVVKNIAGTPTTITMPNGVYPCIQRFLYTMRSKVNDDTFLSDFDIEFSPTAYRIILSASVFFRIEWTDTLLRDYLGFTDTVIATDTGSHWEATATYCPRHVWIPTHVNADQNLWHRMIGEEFKGKKTLSGRISGITVGPQLYYRNFSFVAEPRANVLIQGGTTEQNRLRSAEQFFADAMNSVTTNSNITTKGFYIFHDINNIYVPVNWDFDDGGIASFEDSVTPDYFVYAHPDSEDCFELSEPHLPVSTLYYGLKINVHSASAPTWTAP